MTRKLFGLAAWASVGFIIYATLVPGHLRPTIQGVGPDCDRFAAYAVASALMILAYPRHAIRIGLVMVMVAIVLEVAQLATPDRDARVVDTLIKIAGALVGTGVAAFGDRWAVRRGLLAAAMTAV